MKILIVDDEQVALTSVRRLLRRRNIRNVEICDNGKEAISKIKEQDFDIVILDLLMPEVDGFHVMEATKPFKHNNTEFIMLTAVEDVSTAVKAIRLGAYDYLVKPVDNERLLLSIERAYEHKGLLMGLAGTLSGSNKTDVPEPFADIITQCPRMKELLSYAHVMARGGNPFLITGESGTGKELMARGIHKAGPNPNGPFIPVNVSSIPETLFESQLFGHTKGAFTGADKDYKGYFEQADMGTLFLDEIGELPVNLQAKLLRVLEDKYVTRIGEIEPRHVEVRIISATNTDLRKACREGRFRLDLNYRLKSAHVHLPPLQERGGDIPLLASHFLKKACMRHKKDIQGLSPEALDMLMNKNYPGNIRELAQVVENGVLLAKSATILPQDLYDGHERPSIPTFARSLCSLKENYDTHLAYVLTHTKGDRKKASDILGVTVRQLQRKLAQMKDNPRRKSLINDL